MSLDSKDKTSTDADVNVLDAAPEVDISLADNPHRGLRMRHVQLIAISGSIGSALFVSIGGTLTSAGPLGLLIGVILWGLVVFAASNCLIEMTTLLPLDGGFVAFASRFVDRSFGMALGWNYLITQWALVCFEFVAINVIVEYWTLDLNPAILISVCIVVIGALNLWSVRWYGEAEFWISITKLMLMAGLTLYTFVTMVGGNPLHDKYGFRFWKTPGPFAGQTSGKDIVRGIFDSICWATFAIVGPDYISLIGGEVRNPRRILPRAFNSTIYRILGFYVTGALCVGIVSASNDESLLGAISAGAPGAAKSPYVISMNRLQIPILPSIINALILVSLFSTANSFVFAASRALLGLAQAGQAPRVLTRLNRQGVPYLTVLITLAFGTLAYLSVSQGTVKVLNWWVNLVTAAQLVSWTCIAITYLRFRATMKAQNLLNTDFLPIKGYLQPFSGWYLLVWSPIVLFFSGYYVFLPGAFTGPDFVFAYGSVFIFIAIFFGSKMWHGVYRKEGLRVAIPAADVDLTSGLEEFEAMTLAYEERRLAGLASRGFGEKISDALF